MSPSWIEGYWLMVGVFACVTARQLLSERLLIVQVESLAESRAILAENALRGQLKGWLAEVDAKEIARNFDLVVWRTIRVATAQASVWIRADQQVRAVGLRIVVEDAPDPFHPIVLQSVAAQE